MKKVIKSQYQQKKEFFCDNCGTQYNSDEYKVVKGGSYEGGKYVDTTTYVDKCPNCRAKNTIRK